MATLSPEGLQGFLEALEVEFPHTDQALIDMVNNPMDIYRYHLAEILIKLTECEQQVAYKSVIWANDMSHLVVIAPRLRVKGIKSEDLAADLHDRFPPSPLFSHPWNDGINLLFYFENSNLARLLIPYILDRGSAYGKNLLKSSSTADAEEPKRQKVVVEFSSPNLGRAFDGLHLRSTILGAFIASTYEAFGWDVHKMTFLGDWGKPIGQLLTGWTLFGSDEALQADPLRHLLDIYTRTDELRKEQQKSIELVQEVVEPVKPVVEAEAVELAEPVESAQETTEPGESADPVQEAEPVEPVLEAVEPTQEAAEPVQEAVEPAEPTEPLQETTESTEPVEPVPEAVEPTQDAVERVQETTELAVEVAEPAELVELAEPVDPAQETTEPAEPADPVQEAEPVELVLEAVEPTQEAAEPVQEAVEPAEPTEPLQETTESTEPVEPVPEAVEPTQDTVELVQETADHNPAVVESTQETIEPFEDVQDTIQEAVEPVQDATGRIESVRETVEPPEQIEPLHETAEPLTEAVKPAPETAEPVKPVQEDQRNGEPIMIHNIEAEKNLHFKQLEDGDPDTVALLTKFRKLSNAEYVRLYARLGITFDEYSGESLFSKDIIQEVEDTLKAKEMYKETADGWFIELSNTDVKGLGSMKARFPDGTTTYLLRDIAAALDRYRTHSFDKMFYVASARQTSHFLQVFKVLELMGFSDLAQRLEHFSFGDVHGLSTKNGANGFLLADTLDQCRDAVKLALEADQDTASQFFGHDSTSLADTLGAMNLVIDDLSTRRVTTFEFDVNKLASTDDSPGTTLQKSLSQLTTRLDGVKLDRAELETADYSVFEDDTAFADVLRLLIQFPGTVRTSWEKLESTHLTTYLYAINELLPSIWEEVIIDDEAGGPSSTQNAAKLAVYECLRQTMVNAMKILGMVPLST